MEPMINALLALAPGDFTFATIKPDGFLHTEEILNMIRIKDFNIHYRTQNLTRAEVRALYYSHIDKPYYDRNEAHNLSGPVTVMVIEGEGVLDWWRNEAMPVIREKWASTDPNNRPANVVHGSDTPEAAFREAHYFFN